MHYENAVKIKKNPLFTHKNENIFKNYGPILENLSLIVFFLNSAYMIQYLNKSVKDWIKKYSFEMPPLKDYLKRNTSTLLSPKYSSPIHTLIQPVVMFWTMCAAACHMIMKYTPGNHQQQPGTLSVRWEVGFHWISGSYPVIWAIFWYPANYPVSGRILRNIRPDTG